MTKRLYPNDWPSFLEEPMSNKFEVIHFKESHGEGLKTKVPFQKGEMIFRFMGIVIPYQTLFTLQLKDGSYIHDPYVMGKVLHSCDPNMICDMESRTFTATRNIEAGEILTMDYETTEDVLFRQFDCGCGSEKCRGRIKGKKLA